MGRLIIRPGVDQVTLCHSTKIPPPVAMVRDATMCAHRDATFVLGLLTIYIACLRMIVTEATVRNTLFMVRMKK